MGVGKEQEDKEQEDKEWDVWNAGGSPGDEEGTSSPSCPPS